MRSRLRHWLSTLGGSPALPLMLDRRRIFVLPTGAGLAFGCALIAMLLTAINYTLSLGFALVFMLAGLGQVALLHAFRNLYALRLRDTMPEPVFAGQTARFPIWLDNEAARPRPALQFAMPGIAPSRIDLDPRQSRVVTLNMPTTRRGWLAPGRITVSTRYPLGLIRAWSYATPTQPCLVLPQPEPGRPPLPAAASGETGAHPSGEGSEEFAGLRDHRAADSPRHIAWKTSARTPDSPLLTKQFTGSSGGDLWLDFAQLPAALSLEQRLSRLTGWVIDADAAGLHYGLSLPGLRIPPSGGPSHRARVLRALALYGLPA
jgi:uncharacterized protein (DUF58 family)